MCVYLWICKSVRIQNWSFYIYAFIIIFAWAEMKICFYIWYVNGWKYIGKGDYTKTWTCPLGNFTNSYYVATNYTTKTSKKFWGQDMSWARRTTTTITCYVYCVLQKLPSLLEISIKQAKPRSMLLLEEARRTSQKSVLISKRNASYNKNS